MGQRNISELEHIPLASSPTPYSNYYLNDSDFRASFVRFIWVDFANNPRCRILPWGSFQALLKKESPSVNLPKITLGYVGGRGAPGFTPIGSWSLTVDRSSPRYCGDEDTLTIFGWFMEVNPTIGQRLAAPLCPRYILHRTLQYAKEVAGIELLVGFETEYILLSSIDPITAINKHGWNDILSMPSGSKESVVTKEIAKNIENAHIKLEMYHAEAATGQYEVVTGHMSPLEAADALVMTRDIIMNTASKHNVRATLSPRVFENDLGSGCHAHISLRHTTADPPAPSASYPNLNHFEACFLSSLLGHLPSIQAFTQPLPASYLRVVDNLWTGGTWVCWGTDNKETPVRLVDAHLEGKGRRFEVKCMDGMSNPYISLASIIAAGTEGIVTNQRLNMLDLNNNTAAELSDSERERHGIVQKMSLSTKEARESLKQDKVLNELLGEEFVDAYLRVNKTLEDWIEELPEFGNDQEKLEVVRKRYIEHY